MHYLPTPSETFYTLCSKAARDNLDVQYELSYLQTICLSHAGRGNSSIIFELDEKDNAAYRTALKLLQLPTIFSTKTGVEFSLI